MSAEQGGSRPDPYELLGVDRKASAEQVAQAWRRRARAEHPDTRPHDAAAPTRFRMLAEAYRVLADPGRRAAYDRASGRQSAPSTGTSEAPLRAGPMIQAGPVRIEPLPGDPASGPLTDEDAVLARLLSGYLARRRRPW
jgi:curved DNA-binding protein CbpA